MQTAIPSVLVAQHSVKKVQILIITLIHRINKIKLGKCPRADLQQTYNKTGSIGAPVPNWHQRLSIEIFRNEILAA